MTSGPLVTIVETRAFIARASAIMADEDREALKSMLATDPECGAVMRGTGGVRKVRVALAGRGKSGGARVVYYYRNGTMPLFLLAIFAKNEKDNLSQAERNDLAALVQVLVNTYGN
ncbi:type II toxin-antitoxin system RelE/ParE family toxin [Rhodospirillum sp. A1_3_36]|uniref:type II toxin-antitoxin system RelE/ParE family toxin n=1 Tax=Rhodospirillum sp. A1_3_36 TaxID=3391666 RepID=UPI0039A4AD61